MEEFGKGGEGVAECGISRSGAIGGRNEENADDLGTGVADAAEFEEVAVHVQDLDVVLPDADLPQLAQLPAGALEELQRGVQVGGEVVGGEWCGHD